jgi:hypothetical protein
MRFDSLSFRDRKNETRLYITAKTITDEASITTVSGTPSPEKHICEKESLPLSFLHR